MAALVPGHRDIHQIINLLGNYGTVIVLRNGIAFRIDRIVPYVQGVWSVHMSDRRGRQVNETMMLGDMWYVTRKDLVGWDKPPSQ